MARLHAFRAGSALCRTNPAKPDRPQAWQVSQDIVDAAEARKLSHSDPKQDLCETNVRRVRNERSVRDGGASFSSFRSSELRQFIWSIFPLSPRCAMRALHDRFKSSKTAEVE